MGFQSRRADPGDQRRDRRVEMTDQAIQDRSGALSVRRDTASSVCNRSRAQT